MAKNVKIPDPLERRDLLQRGISGEQALAIAEAYLSEERREDAVDFLHAAGADERLDALAEEAVETGNVFLLQEVSRVRGGEPPIEAWERLEQAARAAGKDLYAAAAARHAHRHED